jgi:hypothetical protein
MILAPTLLLNAGSGAAIARPTFSRDFAGEKTLNNGTGPAITFTRASNATFFDANGTLQTAANDTPRFDHSGGSSLGLLIEEARTNLLVRSAELDNASWSKSNASITANTTLAPDSTLTGDKLVESVSTTIHRVVQQVTTSATATNTGSVYIKAAERTQVNLALIESTGTHFYQAVFDLNTLGISAGGSGTFTNTATSITSVGSGWFRCSVTAAFGSGTAVRLAIDTAASGSAITTGDGTSGLYIWGAQLEAGAFPTSYIPTTTAAATRAADSAVVTPISSFYNQSEGTLFGEARLARQATGFTPILFIGNSGNHVDIRYRATAATGFFVTVNLVDAGVTFNGGSAIAANAIARAIGAYKANDFAFSQNGEAAQVVSSGTLPNPTQLGVGSDTGTFFNGHIRKLAYWPKRLSDTLLQQLTT